MLEYEVSWLEGDSGDEPGDIVLHEERVIIAADSALEAEVTVSREYGVKRHNLTVKRVA